MLPPPGPPAVDDIPECDVPTTYVYVITDDSHLYRFEPDKLLFTEIGEVRCPTTELPFSMAVDRHGRAWVNYDRGGLFQVSTRTAACTTTTFSAGAGANGFIQFGMGFATDGDTSKETLYVAGVTPALGLGRLDTTTMKIEPIGDFTRPLAGQWAELTGTGGGLLFGYFQLTDETLIAKIGTDTGEATTLRVLSREKRTTSDWAFSFWGGDFWFYTAREGGTSQVTRLRTATDGSYDVVVPDTHIRIVGAGVSTCAPRAPVN